MLTFEIDFFNFCVFIRALAYFKKVGSKCSMLFSLHNKHLSKTMLF